jgi:hypothetical protein
MIHFSRALVGLPRTRLRAMTSRPLRTPCFRRCRCISASKSVTRPSDLYLYLSFIIPSGRSTGGAARRHRFVGCHLAYSILRVYLLLYHFPAADNVDYLLRSPAQTHLVSKCCGNDRPLTDPILHASAPMRWVKRHRERDIEGGETDARFRCGPRYTAVVRPTQKGGYNSRRVTPTWHHRGPV